MAERFLSARQAWPNPPFPLVNSHPLRIGPERFRARSGRADLDGEDRSGIMRHEGKGDRCKTVCTNEWFCNTPARMGFQGVRSCETVLQLRLYAARTAWTKDWALSASSRRHGRSLRRRVEGSIESLPKSR